MAEEGDNHDSRLQLHTIHSTADREPLRSSHVRQGEAHASSDTLRIARPGRDEYGITMSKKFVNRPENIVPEMLEVGYDTAVCMMMCSDSRVHVAVIRDYRYYPGTRLVTWSHAVADCFLQGSYIQKRSIYETWERNAPARRTDLPGKIDGMPLSGRHNPPPLFLYVNPWRFESVILL